MKVLHLLSALLVGVVSLLMLFTAPVQAASCDLTKGSGALPLPTWYQYLPGDDSSGTCKVANEGITGAVFVLVLLGIFDILLYVAGFAAVVFVIWGGFRLLTSTGEPQKIAAARTTIFNSLIGMGIAIVASQLVGFIAGKLV